MERSEIFYDTALSLIHDRYFGQLALDASEEIKCRCSNTDPSTLQVIDLGCGSGILAKQLSDRGFKVLGVDISPSMLEIAKQNAPRAAFIQASLYDFHLPPCNIVCAIGEPLNYFTGNKHNDNTILNLFNNIYNQLQPKGYFIFDLLTIEVDKLPYTKLIENEQMTMIVQVSVDVPASILTRKMTFFTKEKSHYIKHQETHHQQLFDRVRITNLLHQAGFKVTVTSNYNNHSFRQGHIAFICEK